MIAEKATIIDRLVDAAEYALEALDNYADVVDWEDGQQTPNVAMLAQMELNAALEVFRLRRKEQDEDVIL